MTVSKKDLDAHIPFNDEELTEDDLKAIEPADLSKKIL